MEPSCILRSLHRSHIDYESLCKTLLELNQAKECHIFLCSQQDEMKCGYSSNGLYRRYKRVKTVTLETLPFKKFDIIIDTKIVASVLLDNIVYQTMSAFHDELKVMFYFTHLKKLEYLYILLTETSVLDSAAELYKTLHTHLPPETIKSKDIVSCLHAISEINDAILDNRAVINLMGNIKDKTQLETTSVDKIVKNCINKNQHVRFTCTVDETIPKEFLTNVLSIQVMFQSVIKYITKRSLKLTAAKLSGAVLFKITGSFYNQFIKAVESQYIDMEFLLIPLAIRHFKFHMEQISDLEYTITLEMPFTM